MPDVTTTEQFPYLCLDDTMQRQGIEDLALAVDTALFRAQSDVAMVSQRPKAQMRRTSGTQVIAGGAAPATVVFTHTVVDYEPTPAWCTTGTGVMVPNQPGIYYVELAVQFDPASTGSVYYIEVAYNGVVQFSRKYTSGDATGLPLKISGYVIVSQATLQLTSRVRIYSAAASSGTVIMARLTAQYLIRCAAPLNANPWMEKTISPWTGTLTAVSLSATQAYRGNTSLLSVPAAVSSLVRSEAVPVTVGAVYNGTAWIRADTVGGENHRAEIQWFDGASVLLSTSTGANVVAATTEWRQVAVNGTAPALAVTARLVVHHTGAGLADIYVDDAQIAASC